MSVWVKMGLMDEDMCISNAGGGMVGTGTSVVLIRILIHDHSPHCCTKAEETLGHDRTVAWTGPTHGQWFHNQQR